MHFRFRFCVCFKTRTHLSDLFTSRFAIHTELNRKNVGRNSLTMKDTWLLAALVIASQWNPRLETSIARFQRCFANLVDYILALFSDVVPLFCFRFVVFDWFPPHPMLLDFTPVNKSHPDTVIVRDHLLHRELLNLVVACKLRSNFYGSIVL